MARSTFPTRRLALLAAIVAVSCAVPSPAVAAADQHRYVRVLVKLRGGTPNRAARRALAGLGAKGGHGLRDLHVAVVWVPRAHAATAVRRLRRARFVKYVERNRHVLRVAGSNFLQATPGDPLWGQQWGISKIEAPVAWSVTKGSPDVVVAVLDTGVDFAQPDLQGAVAPGYDFVNKDADPTDDHGHGTGVAGVIAARADNGLGGSGVCPRCTIMPVKVVGADGTATELNVASGITWAADHGARVINLSLGGTFGSTVADAVKYATAKGVLVVAAAGNNGNSAPFYPAADQGVLSVGATQPDDTLYSWSDYGSWVAVAAPGCNVTTGLAGGFGGFCGTSASTPVVSGLAALAWSFAPGASADAITAAITTSAHSLRSVEYGRVDAAGTLAALGATFQPAPQAPVAPAPQAQPAAAAPPVSTAMSNAGVTRATVATHQRRRRQLRRIHTVPLLRRIPLALFGRSH